MSVFCIKPPQSFPSSELKSLLMTCKILPDLAHHCFSDLFSIIPLLVYMILALLTSLPFPELFQAHPDLELLDCLVPLPARYPNDYLLNLQIFQLSSQSVLLSFLFKIQPHPLIPYSMLLFSFFIVLPVSEHEMFQT